MSISEPVGSSDAERLRRLQALDELLPALTGVLDIREVFERVSHISQRVLPHDMIALPLLAEDKNSATVHAAFDAEKRIPRYPQPFPLTETHKQALQNGVDHRIFDEVTPENADFVGPPAQHGIKSMLRVVVRLQQEVVGCLDFGSYKPHAYTQADLMIARRIADHVAMALSHQRLADESRRAAALQERNATLELLDGLLGAVTDVLDIREIFTRISEIAGKVLTHDAMGIPIVTDDREHMIVHASAGLEVSDLGIIPIHESMRPLVRNDWEFDIVKDLQTENRGLGPERLVTLGFRSVLRAPIRIGGQLAAMLSFFSRTPGFYKPADALIARRIAAHVAMLMSHQRLAEESRRAAALTERAANLEMLDGLLNTLAAALDVREVFEQVSAVAQTVLPHDMIALPMLTEDRKHFTVYARAGRDLQQPETLPLDKKYQDLIGAGFDYVITPDMQADPVDRESPPAKAGCRSHMLVPVRVHGELVGGLAVFSFQPNVFTPPDVLVARRIADHIALVLSHQRLAEQAQRAAEERERAALLERRVDVLTAEVQALGGHRRVIGDSKAWKDVLKQATQVAPTDATVLLLGDSGTGKEVVARFIHRASGRSGPFVALNCAALPEQLLESELFGYERGAFTGALNAKPGQIEQAAGGVLFLDEVSEMSLSAQAKFLRVLQEREFQRLGGTRILKANVRVIAATNRDLQAAIERGAFREDLYYRLHVFEIALPRLRDRPEDVLPLSEAFLEEIARGFGRPPAGISREARRLLMEYHWPGNVRQLRNTLERAAILCEGCLITGEHLSLPGAKPVAAHPVPTPVPAAIPALPDNGGADLRAMERAAIEKALLDTKYNKSKAAKLLGLTRTQLYVRLRKYGLES